MTPSWDDAPSWANWLAMDEWGGWCWYEREPTIREDGYWTNEHFGKWEDCQIKCKDWRDTLQPRPLTPGSK